MNSVVYNYSIILNKFHFSGCWTTQHNDGEHPEYCDEDVCLGRPQKKHPGTYFCCCKTSLCNEHLRIAKDFHRSSKYFFDLIDI